MTELFMKLLNMSINAGWLVLAVLLVRIMFHKAPKWLFPLLWSFVWIRLLMPNALESRLSVIPDISGFRHPSRACFLLKVSLLLFLMLESSGVLVWQQCFCLKH